MKTPVTKDTLRNHFTYSWWKYLLLCVIGVVGWNLVFTMTAYRPPEDKKVDFIVSALGEQTVFDAYLEDLRLNDMPEMEQMRSIFLTMDSAYAPMQLSTYIAAGEGDIYLLKKDQFYSYAKEGAYLPLEDYPELMSLAESMDIDLSKAWRTVQDTGEKHLFGIPASALPGLTQYMYLDGDCYLSVVINSGNNDNAVRALCIMMQDLAAPPEPATPTELSE